MTGREGMDDTPRLNRGRVHSIDLINRETASFTGVTDVEAFNEEEVVLTTEMGAVMLAGEGLHIVRLNLDDGVLVAEGRILALEYLQDHPAPKKGGLAGLFR